MTPAIIISLVAVGIFAFGLYITRVAAAAQNVLQHAYTGIGTMTNSELTDDEKELAVRRSGIALFIGAWSVFWRFLLCLALTYLPIHLSGRLSITTENEIFAVMLRPDYIIIVSVALIMSVWLIRRYGGKTAKTTSYNMGERILHMVAFASPVIQRLSARADDGFFRLFHRNRQQKPPVFITSLARGGTTALLNALSDLPFTATHTYRDMPFITAPYLWNRLSAPLKRKVARSKRAHGDGLEIDLDSPEAFDEVYWRMYWPEKYSGQNIGIWGSDDHKQEAAARLQTCFEKITRVRGLPKAQYVSKNNANIARLRLLKTAFPDARVVVPLRRPGPHAASLLRQHQNFLKQHAQDEFIARYMRDIGHLEFGKVHVPIAFEGFDPRAYPINSPNYWLAYWIGAFKEVQANLTTCQIVLQDDLRSDANACMGQLLRSLGHDAGDRDFSAYFLHRADETDESVFSAELLASANALYDDIVKVGNTTT